MKSSNTNTNNYNYWQLTEKVIGIIILLWSVIIIYNVSYVIAGLFRSGYVEKANVTYTSVILKNHFVIITGILCLFGGWLLLFKYKTGWMLCVITSFIYAITFFLSSRSKATDSTLLMSQYYKSYGAAALLFLLIFILLILKPIRSSYHPNSKTWFIIAGAILVFIIDRLAF